MMVVTTTRKELIPMTNPSIPPALPRQEEIASEIDRSVGERFRAFTAALLELQESGLLVRFPTSTASRPIQRPASTSDARKRNAENRKELTR